LKANAQGTNLSVAVYGFEHAMFALMQLASHQPLKIISRVTCDTSPAVLFSVRKGYDLPFDNVSH
jgi:hypothetical protein